MEEKNISVLEQTVLELGIETGMPSLRAFAEAMHAPAQRLRNIIKKPEEGMVYTADFKNYWALSRYMTARLVTDEAADAEQGRFATLDDLVLAAVDADVKLKESGSVRNFTGVKTVTLPNGEEVAARRKELKVGDQVTINNGKKDDKDKVVYTVAYCTLAFICVEDPLTAELRVLSNNTVNTKCAIVGPDHDADPNQEVIDGYEDEPAGDASDAE